MVDFNRDVLQGPTQKSARIHHHFLNAWGSSAPLSVGICQRQVLPEKSPSCVKIPSMLVVSSSALPRPQSHDDPQIPFIICQWSIILKESRIDSRSPGMHKPNFHLPNVPSGCRRSIHDLGLPSLQTSSTSSLTKTIAGWWLGHPSEK